MNGEGRPGGGTETANKLAKADSSVGQVPPHGSHPDVATLLVGAVLWAATRAPSLLQLNLVHDDDLEDPALATVLATARSLIYARQPHGPQLVADELSRSGRLTKLVASRLQSATTCGADVGALRQYAAAVVAASFRRRIESLGHALSTTANSAAESTLAPLVSNGAKSIADCADRLEQLRGEG